MIRRLNHPTKGVHMVPGGAPPPPQRVSGGRGVRGRETPNRRRRKFFELVRMENKNLWKDAMERRSLVNKGLADRPKFSNF